MQLKKQRDCHQSSENRKGRRGTLIGHVGYGAERQEKRYTAKRCNEERLGTFPVILAKAGIQGCGRWCCPSSDYRGLGSLPPVGAYHLETGWRLLSFSGNHKKQNPMACYLLVT